MPDSRFRWHSSSTGRRSKILKSWFAPRAEEDPGRHAAMVGVVAFEAGEACLRGRPLHRRPVPLGPLGLQRVAMCAGHDHPTGLLAAPLGPVPEKSMRQKPSFAHRPLWHVFARHTWFMDRRLPALASRAAARAQSTADCDESL